MFKKLRNKLILINMGITTVVILAAFSAIYLVSTRSADNRPAMPNNSSIQESNDLPEDFRQFLDLTIREEKAAAARNLLAILVISGVAIELSVLMISYFLAEEAIKPVRESYEAQKIFIANASHEIKTPLAAISANLEAADIKDNKWIKNVELETAKLTVLNTELLTLARTDLVTTMTSEEIDLKTLVDTAIDSAKSRLRKTQKLTTEIILPPKLNLNSTDFVQIFNILLDNAIKYSHQKIHIALKNHELAISNDGETISKDQLPYIYDRFYQVDKNKEGVGLGLSIAKSLADRNRWSLIAESNSNSTKFILKF